MKTKDNTNKYFPIVGIGSSAGGFDGLLRFLNVLPEKFNFAIVFVQHLSTKHKSLLPELLAARQPSLGILEISHGLEVNPGHLYLAPPGREVRLKNGFFHTAAHPEGLIHLPIDEFLTSLAEDAGERAIAVILSGAGTDGARGCSSVRAAGGTIYVQDPDTAEFTGMPLTAISTGHADAVLSPEDIARELLKTDGIGNAVPGRIEQITPQEFDIFFKLLFEKAGARFNHYKKSVVGRRIRRRMYLHGLSSVKDYIDLVSSHDREASSLASDLMIGVTSFFRDSLAWKVLNTEAVRKITAVNSGAPVRVWTPASATGEEAYSITMMLVHELGLAGKNRDIQIFATDINDNALEKAREGRYPASISEDVPAEYLPKYFTLTDEGLFYIINKDIRERVVFAKQNLLIDPPFSRMDLIICRNFLIYLEPEAQEKSIDLFHYALGGGGYLFLGNAETVGKKSSLFESVGRKQCRVYRRIELNSASRLPLSVPFAAEQLPGRLTAPAGASEVRKAADIVQEFLLEEYAPATIALDQNYNIIYHNGPTNRYLRHPRGVPTQNALDLLPESVRDRVRGAIFRAVKDQKAVSVRAVFPANGSNPAVVKQAKRGKKSGTDIENKKAGHKGAGRDVAIHVSGIKDNLIVIAFHERGGLPEEKTAAEPDQGRIDEGAMHSAIRQIESELSATRQELQSRIEQLKSLNEELQSSNEELQAANEELETSREELQSLNEELVIVNSQLQVKIEEQNETNNDLNNFLASTSIPTVFLDREFRVKRFTPAMLRLIKLLPSDIGRHIVDMSQEGLGQELIADGKAILESLVPVRKEMRIGSAWYIRAVLPYRTTDDRIQGVVVTYSDISDLKRAEEYTKHLASFPELNPHPVLELDAPGNIIFANPASRLILESLGMDKNDLHVFLPGDIDNIRRIIQNEGTVQYREIFLKDKVFASSISYVPEFGVCRIYALDITERKKAEENLRRSEELFRLALDSIPDSVMVYDADRRYLFINKTGLKRSGERLEHYLGSRVDEMYDEETLGTFMPAMKMAYETGLPQTIEASFTFPTGRYDLILTFVPMLKDGRVYQMLGFTFDITERKKSEKLTGQLAAIVESADDAIISKDLNGVIQTWNIGAEKIFGYPADEAIGKNISFLIPEGHANEVPAVIGRILKGEHIEQFESVRRRKDGTIIPSLLTYSAIKDAAGKVIGVSKIAHDITKRKQSEEKINTLLSEVGKEKDRLSALINSINDEIWFADTEKRFTLANPSALREFTLNSGSDIDIERFAASIEVFRPDGSPRPVEEAPPLRALTGEIVRNQEEIIRTPNLGELRYRQVSSSPVRDANGVVIGSVSVVRDITEYKRGELALRESEKRLARAQEIAHLGSWELDLVSNTLTWSDEVYRIFGLKPQEFGASYEAFLESVHPGDRFAVDAAYSGSIRDGKDTYEIEHRIVQKTTGDIRIVHEKCEHFRDASGRIIRSVGMVHDITERKQAEEALRRKEWELSEAQRLAHVGSWYWDAATDIGDSTDELLRIYGFDPATQTIPDFKDQAGLWYPVEEWERLNAAVQESARTGSGYKLDVQALRNGTSIWVTTQSEAVRNTDGKIIGLRGTVQDITERKHTEDELRKAHEELEQRVQERTAELRRRTEQLRAMALELTQTENRERKRLAVILHDHLQQILVGAKLGTESVKRQATDDELKKSVQKIADLLDESIKVSRSLTAELSPPIIHEGGLIPGLRWLARWMEEKQDFKINITADTDIPPDVEGTSILLFQSIRELLLNVIKHAGVKEAGVSVNITGENMLQTVIADNGTGFDPSQIENRGSEAGFGLFSIRERMEFLGGRMNVDSAPGMGTRITLITPLPEQVREKSGTIMPGAAASTPAVINEAVFKSGHRIRVLVADDHTIVREGFIMLIRDETDMEVVGEASNGEEALDMARRLHPDVIIMDISMPKMNGIEATGKITSEMPEIHIIGLSMYEIADREEAMRKAGASAFLTKDGPSKDLIKAIRREGLS